MASPLSLNLFQPRRIWLILNILTLAALGCATYTLWHLTSNEVSTLAETQNQTLIKSRIEDLHAGRYRNFVEGVGEKFRDVSIRITSDSKAFEVGQFDTPQRCSTQSLSGGGFTEPLTVELCRKFDFPTMSFVFIAAGFLCFAFLSYLILRKSEKDAVMALTDFVARQGLRVNPSGGLISILKRIREMVQEIEDSRARQAETAKSVALAQLAQQVAHDIRSPIAALETISNRQLATQIMDIDVLKSSIKRLSEITSDLQGEDLLKTHSLRKIRPERLINTPARHNLQAMIQEILSEKRTEFAAYEDLDIRAEFLLPVETSIIIDQVAFKRTLSNIVNNAVEAMAGNGQVFIHTNNDRWDTIISITDTGPGFDHETLTRLGEVQPYSSKPNGRGLGIFHARQTLSRAGGKLGIYQASPRGAQVELRLPRTIG
jgi:signal transduction histidine kinase